MKSKKGKIKMRAGAQQFQKLMRDIKPSFVLSCEDEIHELFPEAHTQIIKNKKGKLIPDKRLFTKNYSVQIETEEYDIDGEDGKDEKDLYHTIDTTVDPFAKIIANHILDNEKIPKNARIDIDIYTAMRHAKTNIKNPSKDTINRIIYNLGNYDIYRMRFPVLDNIDEEDEDVENDNIVDGDIENNTMDEENESKDSEITITDDDETEGKGQEKGAEQEQEKGEEQEQEQEQEQKSDKPSPLDKLDDIFDMMTGGGAAKEERDIPMEPNNSITLGPVSQCNFDIILNGGSDIYVPDKIIGPMKIKGMSGRTRPKPRNYRRTTIVVDIIGSEEMVKRVTRETLNTIKNNKGMVDKIAEDIKGGNKKDIDAIMKGFTSPNGETKTKTKKKKKNRRRRKRNYNSEEAQNTADEDENLVQQIKDMRKE
uniref:Uncharacterized protein n=1 Tax=Pithovirus LCPAC101 TaxID=2506586 RepID=A0A481Z348_9VIRU|nr:MAG: hypothetical protein LCPAC101_01570 [Pithovirus LCPAC101]